MQNKYCVVKSNANAKVWWTVTAVKKSIYNYRSFKISNYVHATLYYLPISSDLSHLNQRAGFTENQGNEIASELEQKTSSIIQILKTR